jgi:hypothetical protein
MKRKALILLLVAVVVTVMILPAAAAPLAGPCIAGGSYDPACDVDQDSDVDIFDIQLAAGHWNQTGTWVSDSNHNHLGQTWTGVNNPLTIGGSYGSPPDNIAPLVLNNSNVDGYGLKVTSADTGIVVSSSGNTGVLVSSATNSAFFASSAGFHGLSVQSVTQDGVNVATAGDDGFYVGAAGTPSAQTASASKNGFEVAGAQGYGLYVGWANSDAVRILDAADDGIQIGDGTNTPSYGLFVTSPGTSGDTLLPNTSDANGQWALFTTDSIDAANVFASAQTLVAVVGGDQPLTPGDVVSAAGLAEAIPGSVVPLAQVRLAGDEQANVVGVVHSRMAWTPLPGLEKEGEFDLRSTDGPAQPGDYVAITVLGAAQVKVQAGEALQAGQRVTVGAAGRVRALDTIPMLRADGGQAEMVESAPVLGVVLSTIADDMVWVLVNPQ